MPKSFSQGVGSSFDGRENMPFAKEGQERFRTDLARCQSHEHATAVSDLEARKQQLPPAVFAASRDPSARWIKSAASSPCVTSANPALTVTGGASQSEPMNVQRLFCCARRSFCVRRSRVDLNVAQNRRTDCQSVLRRKVCNHGVDSLGVATSGGVCSVGLSRVRGTASTSPPREERGEKSKSDPANCLKLVH